MYSVRSLDTRASYRPPRPSPHRWVIVRYTVPVHALNLETQQYKLYNRYPLLTRKDSQLPCPDLKSNAPSHPESRRVLDRPMASHQQSFTNNARDSVNSIVPSLWPNGELRALLLEPR